ncbi:MAG: HAD family hydrolase [Lysobacteraceae bacterium]
MTPRSRPKLVIFDLDDVLVEYQRERRVEALARAVGAPPSMVHEALFKSGLETKNDRGELGLEDYLDAVRRRHGLDIPMDAFIEARRQSMRLRREVLGLAARVAPQTTLALFTNNGQWLGRQLPKFFPELRPLFGTRMVTTGQLGITKPDPQAYYACLSTLGFSAASALMIDDIADNVASAQSAGLDAIHYASPPQLAGELLRRGFDLEPVHAP